MKNKKKKRQDHQWICKNNNGIKKEYQKLYAEYIKYRDKLKRQQEYDQQECERQIREKDTFIWKTTQTW